MTASPFRRRTVVLLGILLAASLAAGTGLVVFGTPAAEVASGQRVLRSSGTPAATGYLALRRLLDGIGVPVTASRFDSGRRAGDSALLIVAAPGGHRLDPRTKSLGRMLVSAARVLLVLPKYSVLPEAGRPEWADTPLTLAAADLVEQVLSDAGVSGRVVRIEGDATWRPSEFPTPEVTNPQLVRSTRIEPIVAADDGILFGRIRGLDNQIFVLSDPDLLSNFGLRRGENARFAIRAIDHAAGGLGPVIIDETHHGLFAPPKLFQQLLTFPLALALFHLVVLLLFLVWAGTGRFGTPSSDEAGRPGGKDVLVGNTADLLTSGGHSREMLVRYFRLALSEAAGRAGTGLTGDQLLDRMATVGDDRGVAIDVRGIASDIRALHVSRRSEASRVLAVARDIHQWKEEFRHGPR
jgi:hypothetical protein